MADANSTDSGGHSTPPTAAIFDLDGTITRYGTYTPFVWGVACREPAKLVHVVPVLAAAAAYKTGLITRTRLKERMLLATLGGVSRAEVRRHATDFTDRFMRGNVRPGALKSVERHKTEGDYLILATASFAFYAEIFAQRMGFDRVIATRTVLDTEGRMTGAIDGENCRGDAKLLRVIGTLAELGSQFRTVVYSDHHADLPLLRWADHAFAVNPTKALKQCARAERFEILDWNVA
ncbi:MAG: HAD-IB family hydrolase [Gammaproteobacteria bacterium]|jgi:HAD superfamily hydrolase (TIGR01490 family)|nr:HAD-IB family hydrolase [Gammaproteobacteria bacterium]